MLTGQKEVYSCGSYHGRIYESQHSAATAEIESELMLTSFTHSYSGGFSFHLD